MSDGEPQPVTRSGWVWRHPRIVALLGVLVLALVADLVLGFFLIRANPGTFRAPHPYYHHGFLPNVTTTTRWGKREYPMITNSLGFRDGAPREVALEPSGRRILFIGDSFVEGIGVPWEETFCALLANELGPEVEILNAAAVSYSPMIYRLKTQYLLEVVGLRFSELVVFIDISDIQDEVTYQSFQPHLPTALDRLTANTRTFLLRHSFSAYAVSSILRSRRGGVSNAIEVKDLADNSIYFRDLDAYQVEGGQAAVERGRWEWTIAPPLMEEWGHRGLELAKADMQGLVDLCRARGIPVTIVVYPSPVQILMEDLESLQVTFWRQFAADAAVKFVNLFPSFIGKDVGRPRGVYRKYFIEGDMHWNAAGHAFVAMGFSPGLR